MATPKKKDEFVEGELADEDVRQAAISNLVNNLETKKFSSGKTGYYTQGKISIDGVRYQAQMQMVRIEPKT